MSTPTRYQPWSNPIMNGPLGYADQPEPDPDPSDPVDHGSAENGAAVQVAISLGSVAIVNDHRIVGSSGDPDWSGDFTPTINNVILVFAFQRNAGIYDADTDAGWARIAEVGPGVTGSDVSVMAFAKVSDGTETTFDYAPGVATARDFIILEVSGVDLTDVEVNSNSGSTTSITTGSVTPPSGRPGIIIGASAAAPDEVSGQSHTAGGDYTELYDSTGTAAPFEHLQYQIESSTSGSYNPDATINSLAVGHTWRGLTVALTPSSPAVWTPAPAANDNNDATYETSDALIDSACARIALDTERLIGSIELRIACENAGSKAYDLYGSDDAAFTTPVHLANLDFTATGSFTADDVTASLPATATYQFYEIQGPDETRRFHEISLLAAGSTGVTDHGALTGLADDDHPQYATNVELTAHIDDAADAHDASAVSLLDTAGWFTATTVEAGLAELAAKTIGYDPHGDITTAETFDAAFGWHSARLIGNTTFTLTAAPSGTVSSLFLELTQDGTGGWTITLPASVVNKADLEADQDTTLSTTSFLVLLSRDGGTTWYGGWWGQSGGGSALTVEDEGTPLATDATTLDFVGPLVTASGAGAEKTITVTGDLNALTDTTITAPAEDDDLRYNGSAWVNDARKWEAVTNGEDVFVWEDDDLMYEWSA